MTDETQRQRRRRRAALLLLPLVYLAFAGEGNVPSPWRREATLEADSVTPGGGLDLRLFPATLSVGGDGVSRQGFGLAEDGSTSVHGLVQGRNFAPGDRAEASVLLVADNVADPGSFALDVWVESAYAPGPGRDRLDEVLIVDALRYGALDLRPPADHDGDGVATLRELGEGVRGLPIPKRSDEGGTELMLAIMLSPAVGGSGAQFEDERYEMELRFWGRPLDR